MAGHEERANSHYSVVTFPASCNQVLLLYLRSHRATVNLTSNRPLPRRVLSRLPRIALCAIVYFRAGSFRSSCRPSYMPAVNERICSNTTHRLHRRTRRGENRGIWPPRPKQMSGGHDFGVSRVHPFDVLWRTVQAYDYAIGTDTRNEKQI